jgi:hypothetical protein
MSRRPLGAHLIRTPADHNQHGHDENEVISFRRRSSASTYMPDILAEPTAKIRAKKEGANFAPSHFKGT